MAKNGCYFLQLDDVYHYDDSPGLNIKQAMLLFDKIYINEDMHPKLYQDFINKPDIKILMDNGIIESFKYLDIQKQITFTNEMHTLKEQLLEKLNNPAFVRMSEEEAAKFPKGSIRDSVLSVPDLQARIYAIPLSTISGVDCFPILRYKNSYKYGKQESDVYNFILTKFPEPPIESNLEDIINFKKDQTIQT